MTFCTSLHQEVEFISPPSDLSLFWPVEGSGSNMPVPSTDFKRICVYLYLLEPDFATWISPGQLTGWGFPGGSDGKESAAMQETWLLSLGWDNPLEKRMATQFSMLAWRIPWTEEPGGLQPMGLHRVGPNWATFTCTCTIFWIIRLSSLVSATAPANAEKQSCLPDLMHVEPLWNQDHVEKGRINQLGPAQTANQRNCELNKWLSF